MAPTTDNSADRAGQAGAPTSLTRRTVGGFLWTAGSVGLRGIGKIAVIALLARLLSPAEFGVVGAALTIVALAELFGQVGVAPAIIQAKSLDEIALRTAATVTTGLGLVVATLLLLTAPQIAQLLQMPDTEPVVRALSLIFVFTGLAAVPEALLRRRMRFRAIAEISVATYFFGYAPLAIGMALAGMGIWALVWAQVVQSLLASAAYICLERDHLRPGFSLGALRQFVRFGAGMTLARMGSYVALNADQFIIARWLGAEALGFYSRAYLIFAQPYQMVGSVGDKVLYPAMASIQGEPQRLIRSYHRSMGLVALASTPLAVIAFVTAPEITGILLGDAWRAAVLPLQILVLALFFRTANKITATLLKALGSVYWLSGWQWAHAGLTVAGALGGLSSGIEGVAVGVSLAIVASFCLGCLFAAKVVGLRGIGIIVVRHLIGLATIAAVLLPLAEFLRRGGAPDVIIVAAATLAAGTIVLLPLVLWPRLLGDEGLWLREFVLQHRSRLLGQRRQTVR